MSGGFCERHGPFDPPHEVCPYCAMEGGGAPPTKRGGSYGGGGYEDDVPTNIGIPDSGGPGVTSITQTSDWGAEEDPTQLQYSPPVPPQPQGGYPPQQQGGYPPPAQQGGRPPAQPQNNFAPPPDYQEGYGYAPQGYQPPPGHSPYEQMPDAYQDDHTQLDLGPEDEPTLGPLALLFVKKPVNHRGQVIVVLPGQVIGRMNADVVISDQKISRQHARINVDTEIDENGEEILRFAVFDFGTPNGTFVNGKRVNGRQVLNEDDEIRFGGHTFAFKTLI